MFVPVPPALDAQADASMCALRVSMRLIKEHLVSSLAFHDSAELLRLTAGVAAGRRTRVDILVCTAAISWNVIDHRSVCTLCALSPFFGVRLVRPCFRVGVFCNWMKAINVFLAVTAMSCMSRMRRARNLQHDAFNY